MKELDILYYDMMMESVIEDRKIMELSFGAKFAKQLLTESWEVEDVAIYEAKVIDSIVNAIKTIFDKVVEFLSKLHDVIFKSFTPNQKLIKACEEKIKSITVEERDGFILKNIDFTDSIDDSVEPVFGSIKNIKEQLKEVMKNFNTIYDRYEEGNIEFLYKVKDEVEAANTELEEKTSIENIKKSVKDVKYDNLRDILDNYKAAKQTISDDKEFVKETEKTMKEYRKKVDTKMKNNIIERVAMANLTTYKEVIYAATGYITKSLKSITSLSITNFKNQEIILKRFIAYNGSNTEQ